jgi:CTP synthase
MSMLSSVATKSGDSEFYTPIPTGYEVGKTKYIFVVGTVMSGLGKGIFSSSLAKVFQDKGLKVTPIKCEGYLNLDSGTLNPFRHGEVFVLDDGMETDMDLGTYERFLDRNLDKDNFTTTGQIFQTVLEHERKGDYLGRDTQIVPHVTGEIKRRLRALAMKEKSDVVFIEIGGTVGEFENLHYIEAARQLAYEEGKENVSFVALTYILEPKTLGEQKSKAAQLALHKLIELGIQPDIIACRADNEVTEKIKEKISVYSSVPVDMIVSMHDQESIYLVPGLLLKSGIDQVILKMIGLSEKADEAMAREKTKAWDVYIDKIKSVSKEITVGITGKYTEVNDSYASIIKSLEHSGAYQGCKVNIKWIDTTDLENVSIADALSDVDGIIVPGGFGTRGAEGKIACIQYAREKDIPYFGLCYGFQMAVLEYARNVCGLANAQSTELVEDATTPVIDILPEQKKIEGLGGNMRLGGKDVEVKSGTKAFSLYGDKISIRERFRHRYEVNPDYISKLEEKGMVFSGKHPKYPIMQILELADKKFFVGVQYHPELISRPLNPHPLFMGFVKACLD